MEMSKFNSDIKHILDCINNLTPWDKYDLMLYLLNNSSEYNSEIELCLKELGYVPYETIDFVHEIFDRGLEMKVLDNISDWEKRTIFKEFNFNDIIIEYYDGKINECIEDIATTYPKEFEDYLKNNKKREE